MFDFFKKNKNLSIKHQFKNLSLALPVHWIYELEEAEQQACYDPKSQSTLRINIMKVVTPEHQSVADQISDLTGDQPNVITPKGYLLVNPSYFDTVDNGQSITLITWRLINPKSSQKLIAVLTYTVLQSEIDKSNEKDTISMIADSLLQADLE